MVCCRYLQVSKGVDIRTIFGSAIVLATFKSWAIFPQISGHPDHSHEKTKKIKRFNASVFVFRIFFCWRKVEQLLASTNPTPKMIFWTTCLRQLTHWHPLELILVKKWNFWLKLKCLNFGKRKIIKPFSGEIT